MARSKTKQKVDRFVLDCSMTSAWLLVDEVTPYTESVQTSLTSTKALVPGIWPSEIANVLFISLRRKRCSAEDIAIWSNMLCQLPIEMESTSREMMLNDVLPLSLKYQLTAYDASYLELALRLRLPIATLDKSLIATAAVLGIDRYDPEGLLTH